jgi:hypothetical protein
LARRSRAGPRNDKTREAGLDERPPEKGSRIAECTLINRSPLYGPLQGQNVAQSSILGDGKSQTPFFETVSTL